MAVKIIGVEEHSIAYRLGIAPGHTLLRIGDHNIVDVLDYRFYMTEPKLMLHLMDECDKPYTKTICKDAYDDLGLQFHTYLMDKQHTCRNNCVFCFVSQMPPGMRDSLYFKDDDSRMSFLFGNYITLTNLTDEDVDRIIKMHISPINISVHTTNPGLRVLMMKNKNAGKVLDYIPRLADAGIQINAQIVLCPDINDKEELERTLSDLAAMGRRHLQSLAVVPVGLTRFREGLPTLRAFTKEEAKAVIHTIHAFGDKLTQWYGRRICYPADEFYLLAEQEIPAPHFYGDFDQLENGVGLLASLMEEFDAALTSHKASNCAQRKVTIATGRAAYPFISDMAGRTCHRIPGLTVEVVPIDNDFFGRSIVVAGLITGQDLVRQLAGKELGDQLLLPGVMLRHEQDMFLDSMSLEELETTLGCKVRTVENDGYDLLNAMLGVGKPVR